jgi:hypothetical protein
MNPFDAILGLIHKGPFEATAIFTGFPPRCFRVSLTVQLTDKPFGAVATTIIEVIAHLLVLA